MPYYFAYASNLDKNQMKERCPESKPLYKAALPNYKLIFADWSRQLRGGKATIILFKGERVLGAVYEVTDQCMNRLDKYETAYSRIKVNVFDEDGESVEAITYIKSGQPQVAKPSQEYLSIIQQGYKDWGII
ncbi:MAG TPA: gamma-glutamylcyclotransferase [Dehalococcoidia bacterium]|nr:gamma-glutamylcyclotransferase [Dehalococcoidia bacterium]